MVLTSSTMPSRFENLASYSKLRFSIVPRRSVMRDKIPKKTMSQKTKTAVFGGGCFWCTEAVFQVLKGIISVMPGYAGGKPPSGGGAVSYEAVCGGTTGHAEVIKIEFDPAKISYRDLLAVFFATHDPTTPNRQGNDAGTQYRSAIFYTNDQQKSEAEKCIKDLNAADPRGKPIVTEVQPLEQFYEAEGYHHSYYKNNSSQPYCQVVINPKLEKVQEKFAELLADGK